MADMKLSEQQLKELTDYIKTKGFKEPAIINEILDHFACKVEEEMEFNPLLSFYDAVQKARFSFGVMGFASIAASFTNQLKSRYHKVYWKKFRETALSPLSIPLLLLLGYGCFKSWLWANANNFKHILEMNDVSAFLVIGYLIGQCMIMYKENVRKNLYKQTAYSVSWYFPWICIVLMPNTNRHHIAAWIPALIVGLLGMLELVQLIALYATMKTAADDYNKVKQFFNA